MAKSAPEGRPQAALSPLVESRPWTVRRLLLTALAFALWTGLLEELPIDVARRGGAFVRVSPDLGWMAPLGDVMVFAIVVLVLFSLGAIWRRARSRPVAIGTFAGCTTFALGLMWERINPAATLLLAVGVGFQVRRMTRLFPRRGWVTGAALVAAVLPIAILSARPGWRVLQARELALAGIPPASAAKPNVLLLILDTVRGASLDFLTPPGSASPWPPVRVPTLDSLARSSVVFDDAIASAPWTLPSHASMFTGQWPSRLSASWGRPLDARHPTVAQVMTAHGYATVGVIGNVLYASRETGLARGFLYFDDYPVSVGQTLLSCSVGRWLLASARLRRLVHWEDLPNRRTATEITDHFLAWQSRHTDRPFFAWVNYFDAHEPYFPPDSLRRRLAPGTRWNDYTYYTGLLTGVHARRRDKEDMTPLEASVHAASYHAAVQRIDGEVGRLLRELAARGVLDNTVVIIAADHGEQLGEHGLFEHQNSLYRTTLHVPLLIRAPGVPADGRHIATTVSLRDMGATILDLAGLDVARSGLGGNSLARFWRGSAVPEDPGGLKTAGIADTPATADVPPAPDTVFSVLMPLEESQTGLDGTNRSVMFSLSDSSYHFLVDPNGSMELYALKDDPAELRNLATDPASRPTVARFRAMLAGVLGLRTEATSARPRTGGSAAPVAPGAGH